MPRTEKLTLKSPLPLYDLVLDTIQKGKQALVFVNSKRAAEKTAEDLSKLLKTNNETLINLAEECKNALSKPTKQCQRLSRCVLGGVSFHHAGLAFKQRDLIEQHFRKGTIKIICCTPTLAFGLNLPAYRAIIRDVKRFGRRGLQWIPTLEYLQMAGRAGRPDFDKTGQAIVVASTQGEKTAVEERYIFGSPEDIYSKLAVEPVLRMYILSLVAASFTSTRQQLFSFFSKTFYAHQFKDMTKVHATIQKILLLLQEWEFITISGGDDFQEADSIDDQKIKSTMLGKRVAQLYIDPLTAHFFITCLREASDRQLHTLSFLQMICHTQEMRPLLRVRPKEYDEFQQELMVYEKYLLESEPSLYDPTFEEYLDSVKTALMLQQWIDENSEDDLLETYAIRPGELQVKRETADWLLFACEELTKILEYRPILKELSKMRVRVKYGVKEELLPLLKFQQVGRVRARKLFMNKIRSSADVRKADITKLKQIVGEHIAISLKQQVGEDVKQVPKGKRKGQLSLGKF